jgi:hypothetical protein
MAARLVRAAMVIIIHFLEFLVNQRESDQKNQKTLLSIMEVYARN